MASSSDWRSDKLARLLQTIYEFVYIAAMTSGQPKNFQTTQWSMVLDARRSPHADSTTQRQALRRLCEQYWSPLYTYVRRKGYDQERSLDIVQGFFAELIDKDFVEAVDREQGRFRWFLMNAISRYAAKEHQRSNAVKRGGGQTVVSIDLASAERTYRNEPIDGWTAEKLFDRRWAIEVLRKALETLESEYAANNRELFLDLRSRLTVERDDQATYAAVGQKLGMSAEAVKTAALRMRKRYRLLLRRIVAETLADPDCVDAELDILLAAIRG